MCACLNAATEPCRSWTPHSGWHATVMCSIRTVAQSTTSAHRSRMAQLGRRLRSAIVCTLCCAYRCCKTKPLPATASTPAAFHPTIAAEVCKIAYVSNITNTIVPCAGADDTRTCPRNIKCHAASDGKFYCCTQVYTVT
jgi:hypothetical protein